ncbi:tRNA (guanine(10)-N2)-methyltransferase homolog [Ostrea edulis]|uniref:tRNA (guanine(10)-N2)-methyltransferase homolog n=1 Tax=Ostrea edulis TaxID=37623 RepID=UPI0024AF7A94|nr:tRNA (guanine(10)-N2)-methyltransferase homolog [Ostrea edulis]
MAAPMIQNANVQCRKYLLYFANHHVDFRISELVALAEMFGINLSKESLKHHNKECPFLKLTLPSETEAKQLASRSVLIRSVIELWGHGNTHEDLYEDLRKSKDAIVPYLSRPSSFKIVVDGFNRSLPHKYKIQMIEKLIDGALPFEGKIDLKNPDEIYYLLEDYGKQSKNATADPEHVYFGRWITDGNRGEIQNQHITKRSFIGNTSMESSLSLLMANLSKVQKNMLVIDPFVGTGSILVPCAYHHAYVMGTDINYLLLHAKAKPSRSNQKARAANESIRNNLADYGLESYYCDIMVADASKHAMWRPMEIFDAVITDPPYGIREGARKVGKEDSVSLTEEQKVDHIPQKIDYDLSNIFNDLLNFAFKFLRLGGRLTYWFPVHRADYKEENIPHHPCMRLVTNCEQVMNTRISRRLITMEKCQPYREDQCLASHTNVDHYLNASFREMYFKVTENPQKSSKSDRNSQTNTKPP